MTRKNRFSLIEVLVVMVIMTVLMTMMMPAFKHMISGSKVDQMTSNLKLGIEQAQSRAVTDRRHVALVLPSNRTYWHADVRPYCNGGFRLAYMNRIDGAGGAVSWELERWVLGSEWKNAPDGAMLVQTTASSSPPNGTGFLTSMNASLGAELENITLASGAPGNIFSSVLAQNHSLIIFDRYGAMVNPTFHLAIAEAIEGASNAIVYPSRSGTTVSNYLVLRVNQFTGKVEYVQ